MTKHEWNLNIITGKLSGWVGSYKSGRYKYITKGDWSQIIYGYVCMCIRVYWVAGDHWHTAKYLIKIDIDEIESVIAKVENVRENQICFNLIKLFDYMIVRYICIFFGRIGYYIMSTWIFESMHIYIIITFISLGVCTFSVCRSELETNRYCFLWKPSRGVIDISGSGLYIVNA